MRMITTLMLAVLLTACGPSAPTERVESLAANPERLKELCTQCKADRAKLGDAMRCAMQWQKPRANAYNRCPEDSPERVPHFPLGTEFHLIH